jgi:hypothetical protein
VALAGGAVHVSWRFTTRDNRVRVSPYARFDAGLLVELHRSRLEFAFGVENLT